MIGLTSNPRLSGGLRLDLAADIVYLYRGCTGCNDMISDGYGADVRVGLDYFPNDGAWGVGLGAVWYWASLGDTSDPVQPTPVQINAPEMLFRASVTWRSTTYVDW